MVAMKDSKRGYCNMTYILENHHCCPFVNTGSHRWGSYLRTGLRTQQARV